MNGNGSSEQQVVELDVPASVAHLRLVRLTAAGLASTIGFDIESLEELRIAVDELAAVLVEQGTPDSRLKLRYTADGRSMTIDASLSTHNDQTPELHRVARELLTLMADSYSIAYADGCLTFQLVKHCRTPEWSAPDSESTSRA